jgi:hypothetical protein
VVFEFNIMGLAALIPEGGLHTKKPTKGFALFFFYGSNFA